SPAAAPTAALRRPVDEDPILLASICLLSNSCSDGDTVSFVMRCPLSVNSPTTSGLFAGPSLSLKPRAAGPATCGVDSTSTSSTFPILCAGVLGSSIGDP